MANVSYCPNETQNNMVLSTCSSFITRRASGQLIFRHGSDALKIVMTTVAEMCRSEAEENGDGATVATFVLQEVSSVSWAQLGLGDVAAAATNEF